MADQLSSVLARIIQRTSSNTGKLRAESERVAFSNNVRADLASVIYQLNNVYYPLINTLMGEQLLNALDYGLSGNVIKTHITADVASATAYWDSDLDRARTIKETIDVLLSEIVRLENLIAELAESVVYDDTALWAAVSEGDLNLDQLTLDTMGPNYVLDGDGGANLTYSLSQAVEAIGGLLTGWPGLGNTYDSSFPTLSIAVNLSDIVIDSTLPQSAITDLETDLDNIRTFIGMDDASDTTPDYSSYGTVVHVADGDSLEEAIQKLDAALGTVLPTYTAKAVLFGDSTNVPDEDATNFTYDSATQRLGIGTSSPEESIDARGKIQHSSGVVSRGGNARGTGANDLQVTRAAPNQVASGTRASILGGQNNVATGTDSVAAGSACTANGQGSFAIGENNTASALDSVAMGLNSQANGQSSIVVGDTCATVGSWSQAVGNRAKAWLQGEFARSNGIFSNAGDAQASELVLRRATTDVGPYACFLDGSGLRLTLQDNTSYGVVANIVARDDSGLTNFYIIEGVFKRGVGAGTVAMVGALTKRIIAEEFAAGDATLNPDTVNGAIGVVVTGVAATNIRWVADVKLTVVNY